MPKITIYKFVDLAFADNFERGEVRISPAHAFRNGDGIEGSRSDSLELTTVGVPTRGVETIPSSQPPFDDLIHMYKGGVRVPTQSIVMGAKVTRFDNCLLFCASTELSVAIRNKMATVFNARAVFKISDAELFAKVVSRGDERLCDPIHYMGNRVTYDAPANVPLAQMVEVPWFSKRADYAWQAEYRIAWDTTASEPFNVQADLPKSLVERLPDTPGI